jgi:thiamine-phosphate pyrophosphorylase
MENEESRAAMRGSLQYWEEGWVCTTYFYTMTQHHSGSDDSDTLLRIIDANLNRLREALRVIEEYFRFFDMDVGHTETIKALRHRLITIHDALGAQRLLAHRDTATDPLSFHPHSSESAHKSDIDAIVRANFKRAQEAARVIEEYGTLVDVEAVSAQGKYIRFSMYDLEKAFGAQQEKDI